MTISQNDIKKVARLARFHLEDAELAKAQGELLGIFSWIDQLQAIDVEGVEQHNMDDLVMHEREDIIDPNTTVKEVLANAPQAQHDMFMVPKVVE
jgi:aspartyl-tRNA(Asn)/glutamyl-tRNA(Gln) amidotransferase subunit C